MTVDAPAGAVRIVQISVVATVVFVIVQVAAVVAPRGAVAVAAVVWSLALFGVGSVLFLAAFVVAAGRSRDEHVTVAGVVWLIGSTPRPVALALRSTLAVQATVALVTAGIRPFSAVAFGILMPMFGLGCIAFSGARHGVFAPIVPGASIRSAAPSSHPAPVPGAGGADPADHGTADGAAPAAEPAVDRSDPDDFDQLFHRRRRRRRSGR